MATERWVNGHRRGGSGPISSGALGRLSLMSSFATHLFRLARPKQWAKNIFVLLGPLYGLRDHPGMGWRSIVVAAVAAVAFSLASSAVYIVNDILDAEKDRFHPRKCRRPIASGAVTPRQGWIFSVVLGLAAMGAATVVPLLAEPGRTTGMAPLLVTIAIYIANVCLYSVVLKHVAVLDVLSLSMGFVLRVVGGCVAVAVAPSTWLLNVTFFLAMFLAFGKRLGERRTLGESAVNARGVQLIYTDDILRMFVVVTAVATLITYAFYVEARDGASKMIMPGFPEGVNILWLSMLPAMYALSRAIVLLERGVYDDPTEMASKDWPTQAAVVLFGTISLAAGAFGQTTLTQQGPPLP